MTILTLPPAWAILILHVSAALLIINTPALRGTSRIAFFLRWMLAIPYLVTGGVYFYIVITHPEVEIGQMINRWAQIISGVLGSALGIFFAFIIPASVLQYEQLAQDYGALHRRVEYLEDYVMKKEMGE